MSGFPVDNIIRINTRISPSGIATANFSSAMLFALQTDAPANFLPDTCREYFSIKSVAEDFADTTETYKAASKWLGGTPATRSLKIWNRATADSTWGATLNKAFDANWWYWTFFTRAVYGAESDVLEIADWCEAHNVFMMNNQTGAEATAIRTPATAVTSIAGKLTELGYRHVATPTHGTDPYSGNALAKHFAAVNYGLSNSTITGEFKKSPGVAAESLTDTAYSSMMSDKVKAPFYSVVELQGSSDMGRWLNTVTHSSYGEFIDDVVNLDSMINTLSVTLYNTLANQLGKLAQTPQGQAVLIGAARSVGEQYIRNGYLGARNYTDPDDGLVKYTVGYEILTKPEDILDLSEADRSARKSAPIRMRLFRAGAIHICEVGVDVY